MAERILITGASGFVGSAVCRKIVASKRQATACYRITPKTHDPALAMAVVGDIGATTDWRAALKGCDAVIHLAGVAHGKGSDFREVNIEGTLQLARQALEAGIKRFLFVSTIGVNGTYTAENQTFCEEDIAAAMTDYASSKYEAEQQLQTLLAARSMEWVIIRPPLVYGWGAPGNFNRLMRLIASGVPLPFANIRNNRRSLIGVDHLASLLLYAIDHPRAANELFLVKDQADYSTVDLLRLTAQAMDKPLRLFPIPTALIKMAAQIIGKKALASAFCDSLCIDSSKIERLLGWQPLQGFEMHGANRPQPPVHR